MTAPAPARDDPRAADIAARAAEGGAISPAAAAILCAADPLILGEAADALRKTRHGDRAVLVRVRPVRWDQDPEEAAERASLEDPGPGGATLEEADEVRLEGPLPDGATAADVRSTLRRVAAAFPGVPVRAVRPAEAVALARSAGLTPRLLLGRMADLGLATPAHPAPGDDPAATREGLLAAHGAGLATDAPVPYAASTSARELAALLLDLRGLTRAEERFRCAVPLPASAPEESPLTGTTGLQDLRVFAAVRLLLPAVPRVAVEAAVVGPKLGAVALSFGADTLAGALAEPTARLRPADAEKPRPLTADRARRLLAEAGREPVPPPPFPPR